MEMCLLIIMADGLSLNTKTPQVIKQMMLQSKGMLNKFHSLFVKVCADLLIHIVLVYVSRFKSHKHVKEKFGKGEHLILT